MLPLRTDIETRARYAQAGGIHRIIPAAVARPESLDQLHAALRWAQDRGHGVTPRGAGSAMGGGAVGDGLILDLAALQDGGPRLDLVPHDRLVRAMAGVTLAEIGAAALPLGLRIGPDPSSAAWATVAGTISTNAAGARSYRLGAMDRWVESLVLHTSDGPLMLSRNDPPPAEHPVVQRFQADAMPMLAQHRDVVMAHWPATRKNTAGYGLDRFWKSGALIDLVIGSEGTLGVIGRAEIRLEPVPQHRAALRIALADRRDLEAAVLALAPVDPTTIELLDRSLLQLIAHGIPGHESSGPWNHAAALLLVDIEADHADALAARLADATEALRTIAIDVRTASTSAEISELWAVRHHASPTLAAIEDGRRSLQVIEDGCVPLDKLGSYLEAVDEACAAAGIDAVMFGHAGDGHVHVNLLPDPRQPGWLNRVRDVQDRVTARLIELGGTPAGEHGAGRLRAGMLGNFLGPEAIACFRAVKQAFDPLGLFNPGVILPDGHDPFAHLKVGPDAAPLPAGIDDSLQRIETGRRWGDSRWVKGEG